MKFHLYGQPTFVELPKGTTVQDLRSLAHFNRIMKNYAKMCSIEKTQLNAQISHFLARDDKLYYPRAKAVKNGTFNKNKL